MTVLTHKQHHTLIGMSRALVPNITADVDAGVCLAWRNPICIQVYAFT